MRCGNLFPRGGADDETISTARGRRHQARKAMRLAEFVPGYEANVWWGVGAPKNTPSQIIDKLNEAINAGLADPKIKARLAELGGTAFVGSPADFGKLIAD